MSVEDRLFALAQQCRQQSGDAFLLTPGQFVPRLNSQAPDLHAEIRALAAAFEIGAAARINAAPNPEAEASVVGSEIAVRERLSMASVTPALTVARRVGPLAGAQVNAPTPGGWAGDSLAVGAQPRPPAPQAPAYAPPPIAPPPHYQQAPGYAPAPPSLPPESQSDKIKALSKNPLVMGALALVIGVLVYQNFMQAPAQQGPQFDQGQPQPPPNNDGQPQPPPPPPNNDGQPPSGNQLPMLQAPGSGGPMLQVQRHQSGAPAFMFTLQTQGGASPGMVLLPQGGWESGAVGIGLATPGDTTGQNMATMGEGRFQLVQSNGHPVRLAQMQLAQDNLNTGGICLMFRGAQGQQDVQLSGADFCVMNASCSQPIGCGKLQ